LLNE
jgi:hypothetical protein